jgi:stress responsive alpha/beta barrel protein
MIERYVFFKLQDAYANPAARAEVAERTRQALGALAGVRGVTVGIPADAAAEAAWDVSVVVRFDTLAAADAYRVDPEHERFTVDYLRPRMAVVKAWNFEV